MRRPYLEPYKHERWDNWYRYPKVSIFRKIKTYLEKKRCGIDPRELYDLDRTFVEWVYERVCYYIDTVRDIVDLDFAKIEYKGKKYTQLEMLLELKYKIWDLWAEENREDTLALRGTLYSKYYKEICELWGLLLPCMWW